MKERMGLLAIRIMVVLALLLGGAHFWRAGHEGVGLACGLLGGLACTSQAWVRLVLLGVLPALAACWVFSAGQFVQLRMFMGLPWGRLLGILGGVAVLTCVAALLLHTERARQGFSRSAAQAEPQTVVFLTVCAVLGGLGYWMPDMLLIQRFFPGWGGLQVVVLALWGVWLCGRLLERKTAIAARLRAYRLFSAVFFLQLALGLFVSGSFLLTGSVHLPVPGVIIASPFYRDTSLFMPVLFMVSVCLMGAAWCSHLCYFGPLDTLLATRKKGREPLPPALAATLRRSRLVFLGLVVAVPLMLRATGASGAVALGAGLALAVPLLPLGWYIGRKYGVAAYCLGICPLGLLALWIGKLAPWRVRRTEACTECLACTRVCQYAALTPESLRAGHALGACTLCRDCMNACPHGGLTLGCWNTRWRGQRVERAFVVLAVIMHCLFLGVARV